MILHGDCVALMAEMPEASVDAVVTDPPYGLEFMGKEWDRLDAGADVRQPFRGEVQTPDNPYGRSPVRYGYDVDLHAMQDWHYRWATEALRVLKPGGHLLAFGGTRTYHRLACALEDAGFEIRDCLAWLYGSGFPKSLNLNGDHKGWGTALKPAHEPIVLARKPLSGTVAGNVLEHGTGALNVDGCRVEGPGAEEGRTRHGGGIAGNGSSYELPDSRGEMPAGRWPANVLLDEKAAAMLDEQSGERKSGKLTAENQRNGGWAGTVNCYGTAERGGEGNYDANSGGASRFFYVAKASKAERNAGLEGFEEREAGIGDERPSGQSGSRLDGRPPLTARNHHPTVKPVSLMRWLVRLITPPGGLVLDPFVGSGTTGIACALEGFEFTGCEQDAEYAEIAEARIAWWAEHGEDALRIVAERERAEREADEHRERGQMELSL